MKIEVNIISKELLCWHCKWQFAFSRNRFFNINTHIHLCFDFVGAKDNKMHKDLLNYGYQFYSKQFKIREKLTKKQTKNNK